MSLADTRVKQAKPGPKPVKLSAARGCTAGSTGDMERYRRMVSDAVGPLSALRSVALYESEAARLARQSGGLLGPAAVKSFAEAISATEQLRKQSDRRTGHRQPT